jgi:hypothetical protein
VELEHHAADRLRQQDGVRQQGGVRQQDGGRRTSGPQRTYLPQQGEVRSGVGECAPAASEQTNAAGALLRLSFGGRSKGPDALHERR